MSPFEKSRAYADHLRASPYAFAEHFLEAVHGLHFKDSISTFDHICAWLIRDRENARDWRDVINAPPSAASWMETVAQPTWLLSKHPRIQIEVVFGDALSAEVSAQAAHAVITHPDYQQIAPRSKLVPTTDNPLVLQQTSGGRIVYRTLGDRAVDFEPKLLVIDTPQADKDVATPEARDASFAQFQAACANLAPGGSIELVTHRLHPDDITGRLAPQGEYTIWSFPVIAQKNLIYQVGDHGLKVFTGQLLEAATWGPDRIAKLQRLLSPDVFAAHYLQAPLNPSDDNES